MASKSVVLSLLIVAVAPETSFGQNTIVGPGNTRQFVVNSQSFKANLGWSGGIVPNEIARTVSYAANHWAGFSGARQTYKYVGETTLTSCSVGPKVIAAKAGCSPQGCNAVAHNDPCGELIVWNGGGGTSPATIFTLNPPIQYANGVREIELTGVLVHEFGHDLLSGPGEDGNQHLFNVNAVQDPCVMHPSTVGAFRGFCTKEVLNIGRSANSLVGFGYLDQWLVKRTASGPTPATWSAATNSPVSSGISGGEVAFGTSAFNPNLEFQGVATTVAWWNQGFFPPAVTTDITLGGSSTLAPKAFIRPSVVFDPTRSALWAFTREDGAGVQNRVRVFRMTVGVTGWVDLGLLSHPSLNIESKYPVGVAYDPRTTNLLLTWNSSEGNGEFQSRCDKTMSSNPNFLQHCRNEILAAILVPTGANGSSISVSAVQRFSLNPVGQFGYVGLGTPNVVCDPVSFGLQCEVYVVNWNQYKEIVNWRICVNSTGFCGFSLPFSERTNSPGETDFPVALSQRRPDGTGRVMKLIVGTDQNIYWKTKSTVASGFGSWLGLPAVAVGPPSVRRSNVQDVYTLVYPVP